MNPEIFAALISIPKLIGLTKLTVNKSDVAKSIRFEKDLNNMTSSILKGKSIDMPVTVKLSDAETLIEAIEDLSPSKRLQEIANIADVGVIPILDNVLNLLPTFVPETKGASELARFIWKARMIDNPLWAVGLISQSQLTPLEVTCLELAYPDIYQAIIQSFMGNIIENKIEINTLGRPLKMMLAMLLKTPVLDDTVVKAYTVSDNVKPTNLKVQ